MGSVLICDDSAIAHIPYVFTHLWPRGIEELAGLGLSPARAATIATGLCGRGESKALIAANPVCVMGIADGATWFQATGEFDRYAREITATLRRFLATRNCVIYSQCVHPQTERWFKVLGFVKDGWEDRTVNDRALYRFRRK